MGDNSTVGADNTDLPYPVIKRHFFGDTFNNPQDWKSWRRPGLVEFARMKCTEPNVAGVPHNDEEKLEEALPVHKINEESKKTLQKPSKDELQIMWIGHATLLVQFDGLNILTDPVFLKRCSPSQFAGPIRYRPVPCTIDQLPEINAVLISHNHYDHLEYYAVVKLNKRFGDKIKWFVPMKMKQWFTESGCSNVVEMTWWQNDTCDAYENNKDKERSEENHGIADVSCVPAQHWSQRTPTDAMKSLWCGWVVKSKKGHTFYYTGDTGYCPVFKTIGERFGPMDLSAIPIGCYAPEYFMKPQHIGPEDAVKIHKEVRSKRSVGIHWGTFDGLGSHEHYLEPREKLKKACEGLTKDEFFTVDHGEIKHIRYDNSGNSNL